MKLRVLVALSLAAVMAGCQAPAPSSRIDSVDEGARQVDRQAAESHTRSNLASLEVALSSFIRETGQIPDSLDLLVPKYIAAIPNVESGFHSETSKVRRYPASILRDGQLDGTQLKDSGRWGYVFNDRRVIVFVDCTHRASDGKAWYLHRGVY